MAICLLDARVEVPDSSASGAQGDRVVFGALRAERGSPARKLYRLSPQTLEL